jgi:uncharacterized membrane protein YuzA (DUF378 family)
VTTRNRKLIGTFGLLALAVVWTLLGMALAQSILLSTNSVLAWIYYVVVGLCWVLPAMPLISWMSRP